MLLEPQRNNFHELKKKKKERQSLSLAESLNVRRTMPEIMTDLVALFHSEDICPFSEICQVCHERELIVPLSMAL